MEKKLIEQYSCSINLDQQKITQQFQIEYLGYGIYLPYQPFEPQKQLIKIVIGNLQNKHNGLIQSPYSTSQILTTLSSVLSWVREQQIKQKINYKIVYSSLTKTRLNQAINDLQKLVYKPQMTVLNNQKDFCLQKQYHNYNAKKLNYFCHQAVNNIEQQSCQFIEQTLDREIREQLIIKTYDIEENLEAGQINQVCPYFQGEFSQDNVDIIFTTHDLLLVKDINFVNTVVIIDEAHSFIEASDECFNLSITSEHLNLAMKTIMNQEEKKQNFVFANQDFDQQQSQICLEEFCMIYDILRNMDESEKAEENKCILLKVFNINILGQTQLSPIENMIQERMDRTIKSFNPVQILESLQNLLNKYQEFNACEGIYQWVQLIRDIIQLQTILNQYYESVNFEMRKHVLKEELIPLDQFEHQYSVKLIMSQTGLKQLISMNPHVILMLSSSLKPFQPWESELNIQFKGNIENTYHPTNQQQQVMGCIINKCQFNEQLFSFRNEQELSDENLEQLGNYLVSLIQIIGGNIIIFFQSHTFYTRIRYIWTKQASKILSRLSDLKHLIAQSVQENQSLNETMKLFQKRINQNSKINEQGSLLLLVLKQSNLDSLNIENIEISSVFILGVPYPQKQDYFQKIQIIEKRNSIIPAPTIIQDNDKNSNGNNINQVSSLNIRQTYHVKEFLLVRMVRILNLAINTILSKRGSGYSSIFLFDDQFLNKDIQSQFPDWFRQHLKQKSESTESEIEQNNDSFVNIIKTQNFQMIIEQTLEFYQKQHQNQSRPTTLEDILLIKSKADTKKQFNFKENLKNMSNENQSLIQKQIDFPLYKNQDQANKSQFKFQGLKNFVSNQCFNISQNENNQNTKEIKQSIQEDSQLYLNQNTVNEFFNQAKKTQGNQSESADNSLQIFRQDLRKQLASSSYHIKEEELKKQEQRNENLMKFNSSNRSTNENKRKIDSDEDYKLTASKQLQDQSLLNYTNNNQNIVKYDNKEDFFDEYFSDQKDQYKSNKNMIVIEDQGQPPQSFEYDKINTYSFKKLPKFDKNQNMQEKNNSQPIQQQNIQQKFQITVNNQIDNNQNRVSTSVSQQENKQVEAVQIEKIHNKAPLKPPVINDDASQSFAKVRLNNYHQLDQPLAQYIKQKTKNPDFSYENNNNPEQNQKQFIQQSNINQIETEQNGSSEEQEEEDYDKRCGICLGNMIDPHQSNVCKHKFCFLCWEKWLENQLTCPMCKNRVRKTFLEPV